MKGPSLDAIKRFKEQQERKKREEDEKKIKEKISTLEHRAAQGDKKAKTVLKKIEKVKEESNKQPKVQVKTQASSNEARDQHLKQSAQKSKPVTRVETNFEDLMQLAKKNTNQPINPELLPAEPKDKKRDKIPKIKSGGLSVQRPTDRMQSTKKVPRPVEAAYTTPAKASLNSKSPNKVKSLTTSAKISSQPQGARLVEQRKQDRPQTSRPQQLSNSRMPPHIKAQREAMLENRRFQQQHSKFRMPPPQALERYRHRYHHDDYDEEEDEEDDYEQDGFVVDEEEDDYEQDELRKTIRSVFRYDKRRCDLREQELDRQYRAIGNVSTFEDLEREERRASRLAAAEDARALKEEEERKRLKRLRLKK